MRSNHWAQTFLDFVIASGLPASPTRYVNGWLETALIKGKVCFVKSMTYNEARGLYFIGVDPAKTAQAGQVVVLCGGEGRHLKDVFVIPWLSFFSLLGRATPRNSYVGRSYLQYKGHVIEVKHGWELRWEGAARPHANASAWRFTPAAAPAAI